MHRPRTLCIAFNVICALSLLAFVAAIMLWARSYYVKDDILFPRPSGSHSTFALKTYPGTLDLAVVRMTVPVTDLPYWRTRQLEAADRKRSREWDKENTTLGFGHLRTRFGGGQPVLQRTYSGHWSELFVPFWSLVVVTLTLPVIWLSGLVRQHTRRAARLCETCGYDLRASIDRCPECGAEVVSRSACDNPAPAG